MSEYKRLTIKNEKYGSVDVVNDLGEAVSPNCGEVTKKALERLSELEDKLEAGKLVELPEAKIDIDPVGGDWYIVYHKVVAKTEGNFNTREAAEARLKELEK